MCKATVQSHKFWHHSLLDVFFFLLKYWYCGFQFVCLFYFILFIVLFYFFFGLFISSFSFMFVICFVVSLVIFCNCC